MEAASHAILPASPALGTVPQIVFTVNSPSICTILSVFTSVLRDFMEVVADVCHVATDVSRVPRILRAAGALSPSFFTTTAALPLVLQGKNNVCSNICSKFCNTHSKPHLSQT